MNYARHILALNDVELERFVRDWIVRKRGTYVEVVNFSGPGDLGRDVVGFLSTARHEGPWHNYQCKQYGRSLPTANGLRDLGKILYHAQQGEFTAPTQYFFAAPRGLNRNLERLVYNPSLMREALISRWSEYCSTQIVEGKTINLDGDLLEFINNYDFSTVRCIKIDEILDDPEAKPVLHKWFGAELGEAPPGSVPETVQPHELPYIAQLLDAYSERSGETFNVHAQAMSHPQHGTHLARQRERFYDAAAFKRFYRDSTEPDVIASFENDIFHGVIDVCDADHADSLARVEAVMAQAAVVHPSGTLAPYARVPVKQGVCHHFANEEENARLRWRK
jgi:hypothetical protein